LPFIITNTSDGRASHIRRGLGVVCEALGSSSDKKTRRGSIAIDVKGELDDLKFDLEEENRDTVKQALRVRSAH
jgi:hypothetical protein